VSVLPLSDAEKAGILSRYRGALEGFVESPLSAELCALGRTAMCYKAAIEPARMRASVECDALFREALEELDLDRAALVREAAFQRTLVDGSPKDLIDLGGRDVDFRPPAAVRRDAGDVAGGGSVAFIFGDRVSESALEVIRAQVGLFASRALESSESRVAKVDRLLGLGGDGDGDGDGGVE